MMNKNIIDEYTMRTGSIRRKDLCYLLAGDDNYIDTDLPITLVFTWYQNEWGHFLMKWNALSMCVARKPKEQMIAIGEHGHVKVVGGGEEFEEMITDRGNSPELRGPLREVRTIGGWAYACGMDR